MSADDVKMPPASPSGRPDPAWMPSDLARWESSSQRTMFGAIGWSCFAVGLVLLLTGFAEGDRTLKVTGGGLALAGHAMVFVKRVIAAELEGREARPTFVNQGWSRLRRLPGWGQGALALLVALALLGQAPAGEPTAVLVTDASETPAEELAREERDSKSAEEKGTAEPAPEPSVRSTTTAESRQEPTERPKPRLTRTGPPPAVDPEPTVEPPPADEAPSPSAWTLASIVDGDTIDVRSTTGATERVRIIGIDTPERGECGFDDASAALSSMLHGKSVELIAGARDDRDRYDRILRYVDSSGVDAGLELIRLGLAVARYDSRDGYGRHPRQDAYVAADNAAPAVCATAAPPPEPEPEPAPPPAPEPAPAPPPPSAGGPGTGPAGSWKNCTEARAHGAAPVYRGDPGYGSHLDRDDDGVGCE